MPVPRRHLAVLLLAALAAACASSAPEQRAIEHPAAKAKRPRIVGRHEVQLGDTAFSIARRYGVSVEELRRANHLEDASRLYVGRVLDIPASTDEPLPPRSARLQVVPASASGDGRPEKGERAERPERSERAEKDRAEKDRWDRKERKKERETATSTRTKDEATTSTKAKDEAGASAKGKGEPADQSERLTAIEAEVRPPRPAPPEGCDGLPRASRSSDKRFIWPVEGVVISAFGQREGLPHEGIDVAAPIGTAIWAGKDGTVLYSGEQPGYGLIVILGHDDGVVSIYAHNAKNCVADGAKVSQGDVIARVGDSGKATSPSVHFEVRLGTKVVNPRAYLVD